MRVRVVFLIPIVFLLQGGMPPSAAVGTGTIPGVRVMDPDSARIAGWYALPEGHRVLVTWGPTGGYRLLDFDRARFHRLEPIAPGRYRITGKGTENGEAVFERKGGKNASALRLIVPGAPEIRAPRAKEAPFDPIEVRYASRDAILGGLLLVPRVKKLVGRSGESLREVPIRLPGAVVLHGSGDSDRDNVWAFTFAQSLARTGIVTLFTDKRGCGASGGDWRTAGLDGLVADALAGISVLRADPRVDPARVGLVGLSQGGVVAPLAAANGKNAAFVVSISGAPLTLFEQMRHELHQDLAAAGLDSAAIAQVEHVGERAQAMSRTLSEQDWAAYSKALAALKEGPLAPAAEGFPSTREDWNWAWWHAVGDVDPLPAWKGLDVPALAVFGAEDETDNVPVAESVRLLTEALRPDLHPDSAIRVFAGTGHALADPDRGWIREDVLAYLDAWVLQAVGGLTPAAGERIPPVRE
jgi:pimeloyl-ACP methyl ester carboxylesterase